MNENDRIVQYCHLTLEGHFPHRDVHIFGTSIKKSDEELEKKTQIDKTVDEDDQ